MCSLPGGLSSSLICASLTPSAQRRSNDRSKGQLGELRAETGIQLHPESTRSFNPKDEKRVSEGGILAYETKLVRASFECNVYNLAIG